MDIFRKPFVKDAMERFVQSKGSNNLVKVDKKKSIQPEAAIKLNALKQQDQSTLSHAERLRIMKDIKYQKEFEMMK